MIQNCSEQILDEVVKVEMVLAAECDLPIPFQVPTTDMAGTKMVDGDIVDRIGTPALSIACNVGDGDEGEMDNAPTLKMTEKQQAAGIVVTHDLQVTVNDGFEEVRNAVMGLQTRNFHVVLHSRDGIRYLLYSLPNTSLLLYNDQNINQTATVRVTLQSMSHIVRLT